MSKTFFTSDHHFGHSSVINHCDRGFNDVSEMNEFLIEAWNSVVSKNDVVYHLGDLMWGITKNKVEQLLSMLNGNIHLIRGNHDKAIKLSWIQKGMFASVSDLKDIKLSGLNITLCHYRMHTWNKKHYGAYMFHGHSHQKNIVSDLEQRIYHVGIDSSPDFKPLTLEEIINR